MAEITVLRPDGHGGFTGAGDVADQLLANNLDPCILRPFIGRDGKSYRTVFNGLDMKTGKPKYRNIVVNTPATLTKDAWIQLDDVITRTARPELRIWNDIVASGNTYNVPDGMGTIMLQRQSMVDYGNARLSMDGLAEAERDRPIIDISSLPLPIVSADFSFSLREILVSRRTGVPLDTTTAEQETRKMMELVEKLTLGTLSSYSYGGGTIYGFTNFPSRITKTISLPTGAGWTPETFIDELLDMMQSLSDINFNGPYGLYFSPGWTKYLNGDYSSAYNGDTLQTRIGKISDIQWSRKLNFLSNYQVLLVQMTSNVVQAVNGLRLQTLQWDSQGGLAKNFKIMAIMVPRLMGDANGNTGIVHATAA